MLAIRKTKVLFSTWAKYIIGKNSVNQLLMRTVGSPLVYKYNEKLTCETKPKLYCSGSKSVHIYEI